MLVASSWCEKILLISLSVIIIIVGLDYHFSLLPLQGVLLFTYLLFLIITTTWITFVCLQRLLQNNKPFQYNFEGSLFKYVKLLLVQRNEDSVKPIKDADEDKKQTKDIDERINEFVEDIEIRFILKWYAHISDDPTFPAECRVLLDNVVRRFLQVVIEIDSAKFVYGCISIFLKHVKEFRKTVKRSQKGGGTIEELYRYSHMGSKSPKAMDYAIHNLTANVLKQFINWELWNSLPCRTLVSILSRRFTTYILTFISSPGYLNHNLIQFCSSNETKDKLNLNSYYFISISDVDHSVSELNLNQISLLTGTKKKDNLKREDSDTPKIPSRRASLDVFPHFKRNEFDVVDSCKLINNGEIDDLCRSILLSSTDSDGFEIDNELVDADVNEDKRKVSEPVKIYESKSTKTWRNSSDLDCISLGQDMLDFQDMSNPDSQIQELIEQKLWKDNIDSTEDEKPSTSWDILEPWCKDDENDEAISPNTNFQTYLKSTASTASYLAKPIGNVTANTIHNMKELQQSTVNTVNTVVKPMSQATSNAMHKIGDLQDEAAGMVEGILDFGIAGIRKGLRLTGLQENFSDLAQKARNEFQKPDKSIDIPRVRKTSDAIKISEKDLKNIKANAKLTKTPHVASDEKFEQAHSSSESDDSVWINPLIKDSPNFDGNILLEKIPEARRLSDATEASKTNELTKNVSEEDYKDVPKIQEEFLLSIDSPDPEYEESQDLASTIAKLRSLLQQKSSESGLTTPSLSPMPQYEIDKTPNEPPPNDLTKVDGAMPSLYKFCARTATGVFQNTLNTIKTALPGNINESNPIVIKHSNDDWTFIEADSNSDDFYYRMKKLLSERREFCTVDTAYEAIDSLEITDQPETWTAPVTHFDDELDEFDVHVPVSKALLDVVCELISDTKTCLLQESVVKALLLVIGYYSEETINKISSNLLHKVNKCVGKLPENLNQDVMALKMEEMVKICLDSFPGSLKNVLGMKTLSSGIELFISSLQSQKINQDVCIQIFELLTSQLIVACSQVSPSYSA